MISVFKLSAQSMAVHDETNRQQLYLNAKAQIAAIENSRKWLDLIIKHTGNTYDVSNSIEKIVENFKEEFKDFTKKVGDPKLIDTGVDSTGEAKLIKNLSLQNIRNAAKNNDELTAYDSEALYGDDSKPELKYQVAEAAYINYENVLKENHDTKRSLIAKRGALALALKSVRSLAETVKLKAAIEVVNGKLGTIQEQEQQAFNKIIAIQARNDQKEKLKTKAKSKQILADFFNTDPFANSKAITND
jgi:uncharacterized protein YlzI (FlbEa/FlbD family)